MDSLPKDVLIYLLQKLDTASVLIIRQCARRYAFHGQSDLIWHRLTMEEFGTVEKIDVIPAATIWLTVYRAFRRALIYTLAFSTPGQFANRKMNMKKDGDFEALLFRRSDESMVIPDMYMSPHQSGRKVGKGRVVEDGPWIQPRRGDTIVDLNAIGYRMNGVSYWNGMQRIDPNRQVDDYGSTPFEFVYPEFPPRYFYAGHGDCWNIVVSQVMLDEIAKHQTISLGDDVGFEWHENSTPLLGQTMVYCYDSGDFYFGEEVQTAESNVWQPVDESESEYSNSEESEE